MNFEVITTEDKQARDQMFDDLRRHGNALEKQVVKFSDCKELPYAGSKNTRRFVSTWSVAYPRN